MKFRKNNGISIGSILKVKYPGFEGKLKVIRFLGESNNFVGEIKTMTLNMAGYRVGTQTVARKSEVVY